MAPVALGAQLRVEASALRGLDANLLMAEVSVFLRGVRENAPGDRYFIVLELTSDCFFRWVRTADGWYKLLPRVPVR